MKKTLLLFTLILSISTIFASNVDKDLDFIPRPGLTVLEFDKTHYLAKSNLHIGGNKYNYNDIHLGKKTGYIIPKLAKEWLIKENVGQHIISYIFNRDANGKMDDSIIRKRGKYAATAEQEMVANATMLGSNSVLQDFGYEMLKNNYVLLIFPPSDLAVNYEAILFKLKLPEGFLTDDVLGGAWILPTDNDSIKRRKKIAFENINYEFEEIKRIKITDYVEVANIATLNFNSTDKTSPIDYDKIMQKLENKVFALAPQSSIILTKPIIAQIGEKEDITKGRRYDTYKYVLRKGEIKPIRTSILRASTAIQNQDDNTKVSEFTRIAGFGSVKEGYIIKQRKDLRSSLTPIYRFWGVEGFGFNYDYLVNINTKGTSFTSGVYFLYSKYNIDELIAKNNPSYNKITELGSNWSAHSLGLRATYTWRFARIFEFGLGASIGFDGITDGYYSDDSDDKFVYNNTMIFTPELLLKTNLIYPIHLFVNAGYNLIAMSDSDYQYSAYEILKDLGVSRKGFYVGAGLSFSF
ncbi:MAG: hypothetical protein R3Y26_12230 [Rikenellaceae bacterium]